MRVLDEEQRVGRLVAQARLDQGELPLPGAAVFREG
jgi:hypothetical protein